VVLGGGRVPVHAWVGVGLCWVGGLWFGRVRREEEWARRVGRREERGW